ncbi:YibE/F family protein [Pseudonocardia xinjiangensis]|uniref:YibE/F family protein n=1 Tax=Pseudonocardia xinjiangensis TaxID=75289 RepID=A0ABX1RL51_9PSEU|nr:YibE/F family protein [Pseudonocardia xinjiangensis]
MPVSPEPSGIPRGPEQHPPGAHDPRRHRHGRSAGHPDDHGDEAAAEAPTLPTGWSPVGADTGDQLVATRTTTGRRRRADRDAEPAGPGTGRHAVVAPSSAAPPGPVAGHGHGHSTAPPAGRRVRLLIAALLVPCALATLVGVVLLWPSGGPPSTAQPVSQQPVRAEVTTASAADCSQGSGDGGCVALVVRMADGPMPGRDLVQVVPVEPGSPTFAVGDQVVLSWSGADPNDPGSYQVVDFQRGAPLGWLAAVFAGAVLVLGRWRGLAALAALALSFVVLLMFVLPAILDGHNPLAVAVVGSCLIMFVVLYLTHGPSARTSTAVLGTLLSLALIGALGAAFSAAARLTGLDDQTSNLIATLGTGVDARGLLLAGVVIGALGVLDDVTVTQTSAVWELRRANPGLGAPGLFAAAMRIGRDHVSSAVNTLVLAYAGASLPLLLLFTLSGRGLSDVVTTQDVATEVVRTLVGSIGLVASVPITTALAALVASREALVDE